MRLNAGWIERVVRFLVGVPTAMAYFYARHFDIRVAYAFLALGLTVLVTGLIGRHPTSTASKPGPVESAMDRSFGLCR